MRYGQAPFGRGETYGSSASTWPRERVIGQVWQFSDVDYNINPGAFKPQRTNRIVTCVALLNKSGIAVLPKRCYNTIRTGGNLFEITGLCNVLAPNANLSVLAADEFLSQIGCADNDICWFVIGGPHKVILQTGNLAARTPIGIVTPPAGTCQSTLGITDPVDFYNRFVGFTMEAKDASAGAQDVVVDRTMF